MKIKYTFDNRETVEVEVSEEIGNFIIDSRKQEETNNKKEHRHCYSLDSITYEGQDFGSEYPFLSEMSDLSNHSREAFSYLTETQKRRLLMLANGLSIREIARKEGVTLRAIQDCIDSARKNFLKNF